MCIAVVSIEATEAPRLFFIALALRKSETIRYNEQHKTASRGHYEHLKRVKTV